MFLLTPIMEKQHHYCQLTGKGKNGARWTTATDWKRTVRPVTAKTDARLHKSVHTPTLRLMLWTKSLSVDQHGKYIYEECLLTTCKYMYRIIYIQIAVLWLYLALHVWITAPETSTCWSFNTSRGYRETVTLSYFPKKPQKVFVIEMCASVPLHINAISSLLSDNQSTARCHRAPQHPCALVTSYQSKMSPTVWLTVMWRVEHRTLLSGNHCCFKSCGGQLLSENADKYQMILIVLCRKGHYVTCYHCHVHAVVRLLSTVSSNVAFILLRCHDIRHALIYYFTFDSEWSCYIDIPVAGNDSDNYFWELLDEYIF